MYNVTFRCVRVNNVALEKNFVLIFRLCVRSLSYPPSVASVIHHHAKHMRHTVLSSVACLALLYFSILSVKWHDF